MGSQFKSAHYPNHALPVSEKALLLLPDADLLKNNWTTVCIVDCVIINALGNVINDEENHSDHRFTTSSRTSRR